MVVNGDHGSMAAFVTSHFLIMLNGSPKGFFLATRGLRQGDSLSPLFFTWVADAFCEILRDGEDQNLIKGFRVGNELVPISHLNMLMPFCFLWMETT